MTSSGLIIEIARAPSPGFPRAVHKLSVCRVAVAIPD
jgi:hypothetical protein